VTKNPLREAWTAIIRAEDYETHMAAVGQAQANAQLVADYFRARPPSPDAAVLFVGAGTGQMFDFVSPAFLLPYRTTFADINAGYLQRLSARLAAVEGLRRTTVVDDVEKSRLAPGFDAVVAVLVLEHVDWRKAVATMSRLAAERVFVITQENPPALATPMTESRTIPGTMNIFKEVHSQLIAASEIEAEFERHGFARDYAAEKIVADEKKMTGFGFRRVR
jgi:ubiquinone/menaquinone biosynthesis C-methylase UbiE